MLPKTGARRRDTLTHTESGLVMSLVMDPDRERDFPRLSGTDPPLPLAAASVTGCHCPPNLLLQANKNAVSHTAHCPEFRCSLCRASFSSNFVLSHVESGKHRDRFRAFRDHLFLLSLPDPASHVRDVVLSQLLYDTVRKEGLDPDSLIRIRDTVDRINLMIRDEISDRASVRLFGSVLVGTAIRRRSDVNLDLVLLPRTPHQQDSDENEKENQGDDGEDEEENAAQILSRIADLLQRHPLLFAGVQRDFSVSCPRVRFSVTQEKGGEGEDGKTHPFPKVRCFEILLSGQRTFETSNLLRRYVELDDRVRTLCTCVRLWSSVCLLDDQESGTWPPHAFSLLLISFLQRISPHPVLPFLQPAAAARSPTAPTATGQPRTEELSDGTAADAAAETAVAVDEEEIVESGEDWISHNKDSVGHLWISFLRYYAVTFRAGVEVVSVRQDPATGPVHHRDKGWGTKILAIEEPFRPWLNLSRSVGSRDIFANFLHLMRQSYVYFVTPQLQEGPAFKASNFETTFCPPPSPLGLDEEESGSDQDQQQETADPETDGETENGGEGANDNQDDEWKEDSSRPFRVAALISRRHGIRLQLSPDVQSSLQKVDSRKLRFRFNLSSQQWFRNVKKFCHSCRKSGHSASACPAESLPRVVDLPSVFPPEVLSFHSHIYQTLYQEERITPDQEQEHRLVTQDLLSLVREKLLPDADMQLFGSCVNGFGSSSSDMDLCLTLRSDPTGKSLDARRLEVMIHDLATLLHGHPPVLKSSILPIVHAKVPIVKFTYVSQSGRRHIQCDLSLYNVLACSNTRLLRTYCDLDPRVPVLGFVVKHLAKTCDIADASRGSLSSYAYTLLTIAFLQREGILPVLQELGWDKGKKPERMVDGWNTWFCEDVDRVRSLWTPRPGTGHLCVAHLFIRFLKYYSEEFSFADYVVCCRRTAPLTRLEKMWTGKRIAIEDPFLLTHNLGAGLAPQMATFVQSCLILARNHFGQALAYVKPPPTPLSPASAASVVRDEIDFLFNRKMLTNGTLPTGRGCRLCGRIAHKVKDCPMRRETRRRPQTDQPATGFACFACGSQNHKVSACPEAVQRPVHRPMQPNQPFQHHQQHHQQQQGQHGQWNGGGGGIRNTWRRAVPRPVLSFPSPRPPPQPQSPAVACRMPSPQLVAHAPRPQQQQPSSFRRITVQQLLMQQQQQEPLAPPPQPQHNAASPPVGKNKQRNGGTAGHKKQAEGNKNRSNPSSGGKKR